MPRSCKKEKEDTAFWSSLPSAALFFFAQRLFLKNKGNPLSAPLSASPKHRKVDEAAAYITEHYQEPLSLESVAKHLFVSKCYLSRIFKEAAD